MPPEVDGSVVATDARPADLTIGTSPRRLRFGLWVANSANVATSSDMVFVAFIPDVFSRRMAGCTAATSMTTSLVLDTLELAI